MIIPTNIDFIEYLDFIGKQESQSIEWASHWADELADHLANPKENEGSLLPWTKTHNDIRFRMGELSIHAGMNGHMKSLILGQMMVWLSVSEKVCIASLEMKPIETLGRMARQVAGCRDVNPDYARKFLTWADQRICIYDELDKVESDRILGMTYYAARELGCNHIVIDSLTKCGLAAEDYDAEKQFIDRLQWAAKTLNIHVHLVAHVRKPQSGGEEWIPTKFDVKGTGSLTDMCDNVFIHWKNKAKAQAVEAQERGETLTDKEHAQLERPDQLLIVAKQRHGSWEGKKGLWFDRDSLQFTGDDSGRVMPFSLETSF